MAETAPHAHCHWPSWCAEAAGTALMVLPSCSPPPWTGASLTPARSGGPAPAFGDVSDLGIYFAAPCAAARRRTAVAIRV